MSCRGVHCDGCRGGGGALLVLVAFGATAVGLYAAWPMITATVAAIGAFLLAAVRVVAWMLLGLSSVAVGAGSVVLLVRGVRAIQARRPARQRGAQVIQNPVRRAEERKAPVPAQPQQPARAPIAALPAAQRAERSPLARVIELHQRKGG